MNITITGEQILGICGLITAIWGVRKIWKEITKPNEDLREQVEQNKEDIKKEDARLKEIEDAHKLFLESMMVLINHDITGNGIDKLKEVRDKIQAYLISK